MPDLYAGGRGGATAATPGRSARERGSARAGRGAAGRSWGEELEGSERKGVKVPDVSKGHGTDAGAGPAAPA